MKTPLALALLLVLATPALAAPPPGMAPTAPVAATPAPATKLEAFSSKAGRVKIVGSTTVGRVEYFGKAAVEVVAREIKDAADLKTRVTGIVLQITDDDGDRDQAFVDADEVDALLKGIDYIMSVTTGNTSQEHFEASYATRGGLELSYFSKPPQGMQTEPQHMCAVTVARPAGQVYCFLAPRLMTELRAAIVKAKAKL